MHVRRHLLDTRLGTMHVRTAGAGGTPLVLLHMSPLSGHMFDSVLPYLATDRLVILPDRIGFGQSDDLQEQVEFARYAEATRDALDGLAVDRFDVVGIHTGSAEALELATASPERVRRVGVVTLSLFTPEQLAEFKAHYGPPPEPAADGSHLARYWQWWMDAGVEQHGESWPVDVVHSRLLDHLRAGPNVWWTYHAVFDYPWAEKVQQVTQPFLVLMPRDDLWEQTQNARPLLPPQTQFVELPHADSELFDTLPEETAAHIREFLA